MYINMCSKNPIFMNPGGFVVGGLGANYFFLGFLIPVKVSVPPKFGFFAGCFDSVFTSSFCCKNLGVVIYCYYVS